MEKRPKVKLELSITDKVIEIISWFAVLFIWGVTFKSYESLPDIIPIHFNAVGQADGFGGKATILLMPVIVLILFLGLTILNRYPHIFNYPTKITENNFLRQYTNATRMIRILKLITVLFFGIITLKTILNANGQALGLGLWFLPLVLGLIFLPLVFFIVKSLNIKLSAFFNKHLSSNYI